MQIRENLVILQAGVLFLIFWILINIPMLSQAAALQAAPVRLMLSNQHPTASMTITNYADEPVTIQLDKKTWTQVLEKDVYTDTADLIATPPMVTIPPKGEQIIRVGLIKPLTSPVEHTYRLFIQEIPHYILKQNGMQVLLKISVPIFVIPDAPLTADLHWRLSRINKNQLKLELTNESNHHIQLTELQLISDPSLPPLEDKKLFIYLLPKQTTQWLLPWKVSSRSVKINAVTDWGNIVEELTITTS